jgi:trehalose 6-phosphate synthase
MPSRRYPQTSIRGMVDGDSAPGTGPYDFVVVANRLPVDRVETDDGGFEWQTSPGGLVSALAPIMKRSEGIWVGWSGGEDRSGEAFSADGVRLRTVPMSRADIRDYYEGFSNATLWPLYHDVIASPEFHRAWWDSYVAVNRQFATAAANEASSAATVWVHDYQLQLVPGMLRDLRPDLRIGFFNHIPFPGYEIFAQLPWRRQIVQGLLGADLVGFQRSADVTNFLRASRRAAGLVTRGSYVHVPGQLQSGQSGQQGQVEQPLHADRDVRAATFGISIDYEVFAELSRSSAAQARAAEIRAAVGGPKLVLLGVDRLDYTKGILHRLKAYGELLDDGDLDPSEAVLVLVASPSRERVEQYRALRDEVEVAVARINGEHAEVGHTPVHYLHHSYPREEMVALFLATDVMLVTSLRDGMNLVAKEYVAARQDETGVLVLSEFTGAADELGAAVIVNPHDIEGLKDAILRASRMQPREVRRRMRSMRRRVREHDVAQWAEAFLGELQRARPAPEPDPDDRN